MSSPDIIPAYRLRGSSIVISSEKVSRKAFVRSSPRLSAVCAMVILSTRAPIGCRSAWYVSSRLSGDVPVTTWASFHPKFTASWTPMLSPCPPDGDERLAKVAQGRLVALPDVLLARHHPHALPVLESAEAMDALVITADAPLWLAGHLDLGNQVGRVPPS